MDSSLYTRPNKPRAVAVSRRERVEIPKPGTMPEPIEVHSSTECHVTPEGVAGRMFDYLAPNGMETVLEPSAGTGNLVASMLDSVQAVHAVEMQQSLAGAIEQRFEDDPALTVWRADFLDWAAEPCRDRYSAIIMNPPFKQVKKHMQAAIDLLDDGGRLIALVPTTYQHPDAYDLEELGPDTFASAKVYTKIIEIMKE